MIAETQNFSVGEQVAWIDSNNRLRYGIILPPEDYEDDERVRLRYGKEENETAAPHRDRVAHLTPS